MDVLLRKLNYTTQLRVVLVDVPAELSGLSDSFAAQAVVTRNFDQAQETDFVLEFVQQAEQVADAARWLAERTSGDTLVWLAYPKQSSKAYRCGFNRDNGWAMMGDAGFEPVRMIAVNQDWSAIRFHRVVFVKRMKQEPNRALSAEGRNRTALNEIKREPKR